MRRYLGAELRLEHGLGGRGGGIRGKVRTGEEGGSPPQEFRRRVKSSSGEEGSHGSQRPVLL